MNESLTKKDGNEHDRQWDKKQGNRYCAKRTICSEMLLSMDVREMASARKVGAETWTEE